ncbi:MAG: pyridoxal-phosphate dependent enzyme [Crenarchaeota archaeon]|nr:pyridoxal-phosphate dependent enzyme [Thermoproteota archaeon]
MRWKCIGCGYVEEGDPLLPRCPRCGSPLFLEVEADRGSVAKAIDWARSRRELGVGSWSKLLHSECRVSLGEGWTPLVKVETLSKSLGVELWVKNECLNPTHTFIDRGAAVDVSRAVCKGFRSIYAGGLGDFSVSIVGYAKYAGLDVEIAMPKETDIQHLIRVVLSGAKTSLVDSYESAVSIALRVGGRYPTLPSSGSIAQGFKTIAYEIYAQMNGVPDAIVVPAGDGVLTSAMYAGFRDLYDSLGLEIPRIVVVQHGFSPTIVEALGGEVVRDSEDRSLREVSIRQPQALTSAIEAIKRSDGGAIAVSSSEAIRATVAIAKSLGIFVDPIGAVALAGVPRAIERGLIGPGDRVVVVLGGCPSKDSFLLYRVAMSDKAVSRIVRELIGADEEVNSSQLDILYALAEEGPLNLCSLWRALRRRGRRISLSTIHHHLKVLMGMGLVETLPIEGTSRQLYAITDKGLSVLRRYAPSASPEG